MSYKTITALVFFGFITLHAQCFNSRVASVRTIRFHLFSGIRSDVKMCLRCEFHFSEVRSV